MRDYGRITVGRSRFWTAPRPEACAYVVGILLKTMPDLRLGDEIDDFCVKCKRVTNHAIVSLMNGAAAKVRCRSCYSDHDFRHEQAPPSKKELKKAALFNEVLSSVAPVAEAAPVDSPEPQAKPAKKAKKS